MFAGSSAPTRREFLVTSAAAGVAALAPKPLLAGVEAGAIRPFRIDVPEEALVNLRRRLAETR